MLPGGRLEVTDQLAIDLIRVAFQLEHVDPNDRAAFQLRLFVGALTDDDVLVRHVEAFRADTAERLEEYRAIEPTNTRSGPDFYHYLLLRLGIVLCAWENKRLRRIARRRRCLVRGREARAEIQSAHLITDTG